MSILIDSSAWIDFLREGATEHPEVTAALEKGEAALCPPVWVELWGGLRGKREQAVLCQMREACGWLEIDAEIWEMTAELSRAARQAGLNCPLVDILIVSCSRRHGASLLHRDRHMTDLLKLI